jgi:hypothetical protein
VLAEKFLLGQPAFFPLSDQGVQLAFTVSLILSHGPKVDQPCLACKTGLVEGIRLNYYFSFNKPLVDSPFNNR